MTLSASDVKYFDKVTLVLMSSSFDDGMLLISSNIDVMLSFIYSEDVEFLSVPLLLVYFL